MESGCSSDGPELLVEGFTFNLFPLGLQKVIKLKKKKWQSHIYAHFIFITVIL